MKFKKSVLSVTLAISMISSLVIPNLVFADNLDSSTAITQMEQLGIFDSSVGNAASEITRGQFVKAVSVADGLTDTASSLNGTTIFPDITVGSSLSGYVNAVMNLGLIAGMPDGNFDPQNGMTYGQVCTMLVKLLGYTDSDVSGTWPNNYIKKAADLKLTSNLSMKKNETVSVGAAAIMLDRLLTTDIKKSSTSGSTSGSQSAQTFEESVNLYTDCTILNNSITSNSLSSNEVLTDKGTFYLIDSSTIPDIGCMYRVNIDSDNNITKVYGKIRSTYSITVNNIIDDTIYYDNNGVQTSMTLPTAPTYYYKGSKVTSSVSTLLKTDMTIVFSYNSSGNGFDYAIINDAKYSKPEIASNFDPNSNSLGDIIFNTKSIIRDGQYISKSDIEDTNVVYNVTDLYGQNPVILVYDKKIQGNVTNLLANGSSPSGIEIDKVDYSYSVDADLSNITSFKLGDLVSVLLGYDGKAVAVQNIDRKTGSAVECTVIGNSKTSANLTNKLLDNQVMLDLGTGAAASTYNCLSGVGDLTIGGKYILYIDGNNITKVKKSENNVENLAITSILSSNITYLDSNNISKTMTLPQVNEYYYRGNKIDYATALSDIQPYSSIVLAKNSDGTSYDYAVIIDPYFSKPQVYSVTNTALIKQIDTTKYSYIYKDGMHVASASNLNLYDVVCFVSDIWDRSRFIYVNDNNTVTGTIDEFTPDMLNATGIKMSNGKTYSFSSYFDKSKLNSFTPDVSSVDIRVDGFVTLILGVDGTIVDIR